MAATLAMRGSIHSFSSPRSSAASYSPRASYSSRASPSPRASPRATGTATPGSTTPRKVLRALSFSRRPSREKIDPMTSEGERSPKTLWEDFSKGNLIEVQIYRGKGGRFGVELNDKNAVVHVSDEASDWVKRSLRVGDVVVSVDNQPLRATEIERAMVADSHTLHILRGWSTTL